MNEGPRAEGSGPLASIGRPQLERLWEAARRRLERNGLAITPSPVHLPDLTDDEVSAICGLLARRRPPGNAIRVRLDDVDTALRGAGFDLGLIAVLEAISGPLEDRRAERRLAEDARSTLWSTADAHDASVSDEVRAWVESLRRRGRMARLGVDDPTVVLSQALTVIGWLLESRDREQREPLPLSVVAASTCGDAHALDPDTPLGTLVSDAVRALASADDLRRAWMGFGVQLDRVNSSTLTFMLPGEPGSMAAGAASSGQPLRVTHRMLEEGFGLDLSALGHVWVCENPAIVSLAADRLGTNCPPLLCLDGMPSSVVSALLRLIRSAGATLSVHTDFDYGGIAICSHVLVRHEAEPWRMGAEDYLAALDGPTTPLTQTIAATPWSPSLADAMNLHHRSIHEEALHPTLLADLAAAPSEKGL